MRILQILNSPNWSAASAYCVNVTAELQKLGHQVLLITEPGKPLDRARELGVPCDDVLRMNDQTLFGIVRSIKYLKQVMKSFKPDIVSAHMNKNGWIPGMVARFAAPNAKVARVRTDIATPNRQPLNVFVNHRWTDHIVCGSQLHKDVCCKNLWLSPNKLSVVYGSVDAETYRPGLSDNGFRQSIGVTEDEILVGLVGRLSPVKGHEYALKAISKLRELPRTIKLLCVGYKLERDENWLKAEAERLGVADRLIHIGEKRSDLPDILSAIDIGIITSIGSEANSRATLEYMAMGKPVIGTRVGVIPEIIEDGKTGYLVNATDATALANALEKLAMDDALRFAMGKASRQRIEDQFTLQKFGLQMEKIYQSLL